MVAQPLHPLDRQTHDERPTNGIALVKPARALADIVIVPTRIDHAFGIAALEDAAYDYGDETENSPFTLESTLNQIAAQIATFPEGQFVALDRVSGQVVGRTASMRYSFDPEHPLLDSWTESTGDG